MVYGPVYPPYKWRRRNRLADARNERIRRERIIEQEKRRSVAMVTRIGYSGGFETRSEALKVARHNRRLKKFRGNQITVPKRRVEGYYRIRYEYKV